MDKWVRLLRQERNGQMPKASAMTPEHKRIKELEKRIRHSKLSTPLVECC